MNLTTFNRLMRAKKTRRNPSEWKMFLEICDLYLKRKKIKNPIFMEVGLGEDNQRKFFEQLFRAKSVSNVYQKGVEIDILSIGGGGYETVRKNFDTYAQHCNGIIAIHDIENCRNKKKKIAESWRFWDELKSRKCVEAEECKDSLFLTVFKRRTRGNQRGIGVIIKE